MLCLVLYLLQFFKQMKSKFIKVPPYSMLPDGKGEWISEGEMIFYSARFDKYLEAPSGSVNNLVSIPWLFRRIFAVNGPHRPAAALHDYLFETHGFYDAMRTIKKDYFDALGAITRHRIRQSGRVHLFENVSSQFVDSVTAWCMYQGVNIGGFVAWNNN